MCKCKKKLIYRIAVNETMLLDRSPYGMEVTLDGVCSRCGAHHADLAWRYSEHGDGVQVDDMVLSLWPKGVALRDVTMVVSDAYHGDIIATLRAKGVK